MQFFRNLYRLIYWKVVYRLGVQKTLFFYDFLSAFGRRAGVDASREGVQLIVSLTSIPERFGTLHLTLESLLRQKLRPTKIVLYLGDGYADRNRIKNLVNLNRRGLEIRRCEDIGPYKKLFYALHEYPKSLLVTADDDIIYPRTWLECLYQSYLNDPASVHCYRAHRILTSEEGVLPYNDWSWDVDSDGLTPERVFPTGGGGVLYFPGSFASEVTDKDVFLAICPKADDVWWKAMTLLKGVGCRVVSCNTEPLFFIPGAQVNTLRSHNLHGGNDSQIQNVFSRYKLFDKLKG